MEDPGGAEEDLWEGEEELHWGSDKTEQWGDVVYVNEFEIKKKNMNTN